MGTRAFSHDSIFIPDGQAEDEQEAQASTHDCAVGKVKSLQQQLGKNIKFGQPPPTTPVKRMQGAGIEEMAEIHHTPMEVSEEPGGGLKPDSSRAPRSPSPHSPRKATEAEHKTDEKATLVKTSRQKRPSGTIESINLDAVPRSVARLDNSAARHKLSVKPKNQRLSKKQREMSQDTIENHASEATLNVHRSLNKAMYHSMDIYSHDIIMSEHFERKVREAQVSEHYPTLVPKWENEIKRDLEAKLQESKQVKQSGLLREEKSEEEKRKEDEDERRQELIRSIELERLQQKVREQKERELKEQQQREEEKKQRAEQILRELEENRKKEKLRLELEEKKSLQLAEEQKKREFEIQRALQIAEERRKQELEQQRAFQVAEQKKQELEQIVLKTADEQKKLNLEEQKACLTEKEQSRNELEKPKVLQFPEEKKSHTLEAEIQKGELEQQKSLDATEGKREHETEIPKTVQISEQKLEEKTEDQQKHMLHELVQMVEQKEIGLEEKTPQIAEQQSEMLEIQNEHDSEEIRTPHQISEELNILDKQELQEEESSLSEIVSEEKRDYESQTKQEAISLGDEKHKQKLQKELESQQQERIHEELRWQELDQKQRPFTFKVTSGEKQIIFEKVHLSPVTVSKEPTPSPSSQDPKENKATISSHTLPSAKCVPHTAILVTGAQLCGTAVNLDQIKDTACKSLLGLSEERKVDSIDNKAEKEKDTTKQISSKTKYTSEALDNQAFLAEWASIRSKILNKSENVDVCGHPTSSDDLPSKSKSESHSSLRKTLSASAKFSITSAWQKFPETGKTPEINIEAPKIHSSKENLTVLPDNRTLVKAVDKKVIAQEMATRLKKQVTIDGNAEGWIFSKDLPSFLVPNPPQSPRRGHLEGQMSLETHLSNGSLKTDKLMHSAEVSPFGVKLRRTNYSLRFHADPQNEQKRKKRYSAGDSFDGVPAPLTPTDETETRTIARKELLGSPVKMRKDNPPKVIVDTSNSATDTAPCIISPLVPGASPIAPKSPITQKPSLAPKPASPTPPSSPLSHLGKTNVAEEPGQWVEKSKQDKEITGELNTELSSPSQDESLQYDTKSGLQSIPWRDKTDKRPEDRPALKSRHSLDGSKLTEKVETAQPLWITLALQKQKGFRDQQATRDERRQAREAKQVDKMAKENASITQPGGYRSRSGSLQKLVPQEEKRSDTVVSRLQRREQLQKSNTLPTSVTVEITETVPVTLGKDLPKRFSTPDATPVTSEPAWLALAKRKSKAWSDCPQIIK
ncbi:capping protein-inhibiting regulator of actin dynamics [Gastrophryne carolinensis]